MPSIGAVNPTLTIIANALRVGDHIAERLGTAAGPLRVPAPPIAEDRGLCAARRPAHGRAGEHHGVDRLALPAPVRLGRRVRRPPGQRRRPGTGARPRRGPPATVRHPPVRGKHPGARDRLGDRGRHRAGHRLHATPGGYPAHRPHRGRPGAARWPCDRCCAALRLRPRGSVDPALGSEAREVARHRRAQPGPAGIRGPAARRRLGRCSRTSPCGRATGCRSSCPGRPATSRRCRTPTPSRPWPRRWTSGPSGLSHAAYHGRAVRRRRRPVGHHPEGADLRSRPAGSSRPRPRRCRRNSAASATGITATAGCATRPTRCRRCWRPVSGAKRERGVTGCCARSRASRTRCRSSTASTASRRLPEAELPWLAGYEGSSPVRTGNAASEQLQLDVWGETLDALFLARQAGLPADQDAWALQVALMNHLESAWRQPDNGLWEVRGDRQHFTHSKVMAWVAADRMARSVRDVRPARPRAALGSAPRPDPPGRAGPRVRRRPQHLHPGLWLPRAGRQPAADPPGRLPARHRPAGPGHDRGGPPRAERRRPDQALFDRPQTDDGVKGSEGLFIACSFWLVDALHASGQRRDAIDLFERLLLLRNDVGLLSEEWDPAARRQLGNTPQAFSHFGLVVSALQLHMGHRGPQRQPDARHDNQATGGDRPGHPDRVGPRPGRRGLRPDLRLPRRTTRRHRSFADPRAVHPAGARTALIAAAGPRADRAAGVHGLGGAPVPAGQHEHRPVVPAHGDRRERHDARVPAGHGEPALPAHQPQRPGTAAGYLGGRDRVQVP